MFSFMSSNGNEDIESGEGTRILWVWEDLGAEEGNESGVFRGESVFIRPGLAEKYESELYGLHFEEFTGIWSPVLDEFEFDNRLTEYIESPEGILEQLQEINELLEENQVPQEERIQTAFSETFISALRGGRVGSVFVKIFRGVTSLNATQQSFERKERNIRSRRRELANNAAVPKYSGPLYVYNQVTDSERDILELKGPINVAWKIHLGSTGIQIPTRMKTNGWSGRFNYSTKTRFAIVSGKGSTIRLRSHGAEASKRNSRLPAKQWHVRMLEIPDAMDLFHEVAGNIHYDPRAHNQISKHYRDPNWKFKKSREEIRTDWDKWGFDSKTIDAGNGREFNSSNGKINVICPL
jgi:hypothetical protein